MDKNIIIDTYIDYMNIDKNIYKLTIKIMY